MIDRAVLLGMALLGGAVLPSAWIATGGAAICTLWILRSQLSRRWGALLVVAMILTAVRARSVVTAYEEERERVRASLGGPVRCAGVAVVRSSPVVLHPRAVDLARKSDSDASPSAGTVGWVGEFDEVECEGRSITPGFRARVYGGPESLTRGDRVFVIVNLAPAQLFRNRDLTDPRPGAARRGSVASGGAEDVRLVSRGFGGGSLIDRFRNYVRRRIESTFPAEAAPMARALVLGESDLDAADDAAFRASGLAHLLAVSGTHLVLVVVGWVNVIRALLRRFERMSARWDVGRIAAASGVVFAWIYADFAGGSGSANRAAAMLSFALAARAFGRRPHGPRALGLSLVAAGLVDPLASFDLSFLLSVAATTGLMVLQRPYDAWLRALLFRDRGARALSTPRSSLRRWVDSVLAALATTLAATTGCAPITAFLSTQVPLGGILANLLAVPLGEIVALPLCLAHTLLGAFPAIERGVALVASGSLLAVRAIAYMAERATWLAVPVPNPTSFQCAVLFVTAIATGLSETGKRLPAAMLGMSLVLAGEVFAFRTGAPRDRLRITNLDVGQGDASIIDFPNGQAMLVDAGGLVGSPIDTGESVVAPILRARRRRELAAVVLSHPHPDHFGGLQAALAHVRVGEFWDTGQGEQQGAGPVYRALLASLRQRDVPIVRPESLCDQPRFFGDAKVEVLAPCPGPLPWRGANDNSFVLRVTFRERRALLMGDAEREAETGLVDRFGETLRADYLKVGHHGSATSSTPGFVQAVRPVDAVISCGVRNRFGHPRAVTLTTLSAVAHVHRTDQEGAIEWETDGATPSIRATIER